jgi:hypothetical protein
MVVARIGLTRAEAKRTSRAHGIAASCIELLGLFVEDTRLMQLAAIPCAREVRFASARVKPMRATTIDRHLKAQETAARRVLAQAASSHRVTWSFRVTQGPVSSALVDEAREVDLLFVAGTAVQRQRYLYQSSRGAERAEPHQPAPVDERAVVTAYDGSPLAARALDVAGRVARGRPLTVLIPAEAAGAAEATSRHLGARAANDRYLPLADGDFQAIASALGDPRSSLLVLPCDSTLLGTRSVDDLVDQLGAPVVLVRPLT